jgi:chromosome segregation ATPase
MKGEFKKVDARFKEVDARFKEVDAGFDRVDARFDRVDAAIAKVSSEISHLASEMARMAVLNEEQHARNNIVLESLSGLFTRQERVETRVDAVERTVGSLGLPRAR